MDSELFFICICSIRTRSRNRDIIKTAGKTKLPASIESCQDAEQLQFVRLRSLIELVDFDLNYEAYTINLSLVLKLEAKSWSCEKNVYRELWLLTRCTASIDVKLSLLKKKYKDHRLSVFCIIKSFKNLFFFEFYCF